MGISPVFLFWIVFLGGTKKETGLLPRISNINKKINITMKLCLQLSISLLYFSFVLLLPLNVVPAVEKK